MACDICCWSGAERTVPGTIVLVCFKLTYMLYMLAVPIFLLWMVVAVKPVDQEIFGPVRDLGLLAGNASLFANRLSVMPSISGVNSEAVEDCGAPGMVRWNITVTTTSNVPGGALPVLLASDAMTQDKALAPDDKKLMWRAVAQPDDFGGHALSGPQYETPWLKSVGCHGQPKAAKLSGQDKLLVCVSSKGSGASSPEACDLVKASCSGGMGGWLTETGCSGGVVLQPRASGSSTAQECEGMPLKPAGICEKPDNATKCEDCHTWGCKTQGTKGDCKARWTLADCLQENPPSARPTCFPEFKIVVSGSQDSHLADKSVQLFLSDNSSWAIFYDSGPDLPFARLDMSASMRAVATSSWCFGPRSQSFYMVTCLTPDSTVNSKQWASAAPPIVDGPPFNDRCRALVGICGTLGIAANNSGLDPKYCSEQGFIPLGELVKPVTGHRNGGSFWFYGFVFFMILAHMSTLVTYFGGLFRTDYLDDADALAGDRAERGDWAQLKEHRYSMRQVGALVLWGASLKEERLFLLRNWLGRIASVPSWDGRVFGTACRCCDVFMDEGHRLGAQELWVAWIDFLQSGPPSSFLVEWSRRLRDFSFDDALATARGQRGDPFKGLNWIVDHQNAVTAASTAAEGTNPFSSFNPATAAGSDSASGAATESTNPFSSFNNPFGSFNPACTMELAARPLVLSAVEEQEERNFGQELGGLDSECAKALCRLMAAFRDPRFKENLEPSEQSSAARNRTQDVVLHRQVALGEDCTVECLYVARARESQTPLAAYRTLALQHTACLSLPMPRISDDPAVAENRAALAELLVSKAQKLRTARRNFRIIDSAGNEREVDTGDVWKKLVKVEDAAVPVDPDSIVSMKWFERFNDEWVPRSGRLPRRQLEEPGGAFEHIVPKVEELTPWELGRLCSGTIVEVDATSVTLSVLSPMLNYLSHDPDFRRLACAGDPEVRTSMLKLRRHLVVPLCGSRGKGGAQNFALQLLRNRGLLDPPEQPLDGQRPAPTASLLASQVGRMRPNSYHPMGALAADLAEGNRGRRVLFAIFDARHQPTPEYFMKVLPTFFRRNAEDEYELDRRVAFAQVPQTFSRLDVVDDSLDTNNGMMFNMLNLVRNCCGAVTSCGTNSTWQVESPENLEDEVFDARTKIEDTATSHKVFLSGRRSVYVNSPCVIGIAKRNARYLGAVARWSEGAVQLFWVTVLGDRDPSVVCMLVFKLGYLALIFGLLFFFSWRAPDRYLLCSNPHEGICGRISTLFDDSTGSSIHALEGAAIWTALMAASIAFFELLRCTYSATPIVRRIVMLDNLTYFWSTGAAFFWVLLNFYMIITGTIPFRYDILTWMRWLLIIKTLQYILTYIMKSKGECQEASIWRSQQMFFVTAPLHQLSILIGSTGAFSILARGIDKSFWDTDNSDQVLCLVKAWTTFIVGSAALAVVAVLLALLVNHQNVTSSLVSATVILFFMAVCVFDAFMDVWELTSKVQKASARGWAEHGSRGCVCLRRCFSAFCRLLRGMRRWTWIVRWIMDFGMPIAVLLLIKKDSFGVAAAFSFILRL